MQLRFTAFLFSLSPIFLRISSYFCQEYFKTFIDTTVTVRFEIQRTLIIGMRERYHQTLEMREKICRFCAYASMIILDYTIPDCSDFFLLSFKEENIGETLSENKVWTDFFNAPVLGVLVAHVVWRLVTHLDFWSFLSFIWKLRDILPIYIKHSKTSLRNQYSRWISTSLTKEPANDWALIRFAGKYLSSLLFLASLVHKQTAQVYDLESSFSFRKVSKHELKLHIFDKFLSSDIFVAQERRNGKTKNISYKIQLQPTKPFRTIKHKVSREEIALFAKVLL